MRHKNILKKASIIIVFLMIIIAIILISFPPTFILFKKADAYSISFKKNDYYCDRGIHEIDVFNKRIVICEYQDEDFNSYFFLRNFTKETTPEGITRLISDKEDIEFFSPYEDRIDIYKKDERGNIIYYRRMIVGSDVGWYVEMYEYDDKDNIIRFRNSERVDIKTRYCNSGGEYCKGQEGKITDGRISGRLAGFPTHDERGKLIFYQGAYIYYTGNYVEIPAAVGKLSNLRSNAMNAEDEIYGSWEYDEKGREIHYERLSTYNPYIAIRTEYDESGRKSHSKYSPTYKDEEWKDYDEKDYDEKGNIIHSKDFRGIERWYSYDEKGNRIYSKDSNGEVVKYIYDKNGHYITEIELKGRKQEK